MATNKKTYEDDINKYYAEKSAREEMALADEASKQVTAARKQKKDNIAAVDEANKGLYSGYMQSTRTLPEQMARAGITGGATESSLLGLEQDYRNNVAQNNAKLLEINAELDNDINDISTQLRTAQAEARAENEYAKAQALEEYKQGVAKAEQDAIKNALDLYKSTGLTEFLSGIFTPTQIETIVATNGGGGGGTNKDNEFNDLWKRYENTGLASSLFDAGYNPYEVIQIAQNRAGTIYDEQGNVLRTTEVDKSDIWSQFIDWSVQYLTNSPKLKDAFSVDTLMVNGAEEDISSVAQKLADGTYVMVENKNGGLTITNGKPKAPQTDANGTIIPTVDLLTQKPIIPGAEGGEGHTVFLEGEKGSDNLESALRNGTREDGAIININKGDNAYIDGYGWMSLGQIAQALKSNPPMLKENVTRSFDGREKVEWVLTPAAKLTNTMPNNRYRN